MRIMIANLRFEAGDSTARDIRRIGNDDVKTATDGAGPVAADDERARFEPQSGEIVPRDRAGGGRNIDAHTRRFGQTLQSRAKNGARARPEVENPPVFARRSRRMVEHSLNQGLGFGARVKNTFGNLEPRLPKLPVAKDSRHRLPPQPPGRKGREGRGAGAKRAIGIANEIRMLNPERRAKKDAAIDVARSRSRRPASRE